TMTAVCLVLGLLAFGGGLLCQQAATAEPDGTATAAAQSGERRAADAPQAADAKEPQGEKDELQGVWLLSAIESDGLRLGEGRPEIKDDYAVIAGKTISLDDKDGRRSFAYKLDTAKKPREILLTLQDKKEVFRGLYKT